MIQSSSQVPSPIINTSLDSEMTCTPGPLVVDLANVACESTTPWSSTHTQIHIEKPTSTLAVTTQPDADNHTPSMLPKGKRAIKVPAWKSAMQEECKALIKLKNWTLVPLPPDKNLVSVCYF